MVVLERLTGEQKNDYEKKTCSQHIVIPNGTSKRRRRKRKVRDLLFRTFSKSKLFARIVFASLACQSLKG